MLDAWQSRRKCDAGCVTLPTTHTHARHVSTGRISGAALFFFSCHEKVCEKSMHDLLLCSGVAQRWLYAVMLEANSLLQK